ncbi:MAG: hypothetical protein HC835_20010 [Oscillatoriales cyanobacterium RM2_1_1]|nr:hypothetical protein [Oscillatoriales cyanobacterium SM2_3_0]NJO47694.1 hypothetical protein [Oscillatoriales cyanobacterium RM2_1_1]
MQSPPASNISSAFVSGDVILDPYAVIAPGVILQANPEAQIRIATGVCIGMGAVLHAYSGTLKVEAGASIGARVLIRGAVTIGANACIGSEATVLDCAIAPDAVVPPRALIGDQSRQVQISENGVVESASGQEIGVAANSSLPAQAPEMADASQPQVYGKEYLNQLLDTLLPHRKAL